MPFQCFAAHLSEWNATGCGYLPVYTGFFPSIPEIAEKFKIAAACVSNHLKLNLLEHLQTSTQTPALY